MTTLRHHEAIKASAGSGKTYQLAHRYIGLLARGVSADRILALTFSRKAAGEIFDEVVKYLCAAADRDDVATLTSLAIGMPELAPSDYRVMLAGLLDRLPRLQIGTLDGFLLRMVQAFPLELGVVPDSAIEDSGEIQVKRRRLEVLGRVLNQAASDAETRTDFMRAFRQATYGQERKGLGNTLNDFVSGFMELYRQAPEAAAWGDASRIWPQGCPWPAHDPERKAVVDVLRKSPVTGTLTPDAERRWHAFLDAAEQQKPGVPWAKPLEYLYKKLADEWDSLGSETSVKIGRKEVLLDRQTSQRLRDLLSGLVGGEIHALLKRTQGVREILALFEAWYDRLVRRHGRLAFDDVPYLLAEAAWGSGEGRLDLEYRMDGRQDHWLLDEFQDTSNVQWSALANLASEIIQDSTGERSFFFVGDVKQAIYGWRGGNDRLFDEILARYSNIECRPLKDSYRSGPAVIEAVNLVFDSLPEDLVGDAAERWTSLWSSHASAGPVAGLAGVAAIVEPDCQEGTVKPTTEDRYNVAAGILRELDPLARGLTVALLVRTNAQAKALVQHLRHRCPGMPVVLEGQASLLDNAVVPVLVSLLNAVNHPGDSLARRHLEMSPLRGSLPRHRSVWDTFCRKQMRRIQEDGIHGFVRYWGEVLEQYDALDGFGRVRLADLIEAAAAFDAVFPPDPDSFERYIQDYTVRESARDQAVRVMTIHQSKGLGFDVVLLPELQERTALGAFNSNALMLHDEQDGCPWRMLSPLAQVAQVDPVLRTRREALQQDQLFNDLCVLYVALTRAKRALYMITAYPGKTAKSLNSAALIKRQLVGDHLKRSGESCPLKDINATVLYRAGAWDWYAGQSVKGAESSQEDLPLDLSGWGEGGRRLKRMTPSEQAEQPRKASLLFAGETRSGLATGTAIHELFEAVEWVDDADAAQIFAAWSSTHERMATAEIEEHFRIALGAEPIRQALSRETYSMEPDVSVDVWRERSFETVMEGAWITGTFDRVTVVRDTAGPPRQAWILDYKTNQVGSEDELVETVEHYRPQLELYRTVLTRLLGLTPQQVVMQLAFTRLGRVETLTNL